MKVNKKTCGTFYDFFIGSLHDWVEKETRTDRQSVYLQ